MTAGPALNAAHVKEMTVAALDGVTDNVVYARTVVTGGDKYGRYSKPGQEAVWEDATPYDVSWLPPAPENLAQLKAVVPPGFAERK